MPASIGLLGHGSEGAGVAARLRAEGVPLYTCPGEAGRTPAELCRAVSAAVLGDDGLVRHVRPGQVVFDLSPTSVP